MINLKTFVKRSEFIEAYENLEGENEFLRNELDIVSKRLLEYEGIQTDDDKEIEFQKFWVMYGKKGNLKTSRKRFNKLSDKKKALIFKVLQSYIKETPDKAFRKNAETWLNQECWNDVIKHDSVISRPTTGAKAFYVKPERTQSSVNITNRISEMK